MIGSFQSIGGRQISNQTATSVRSIAPGEVQVFGDLGDGSKGQGRPGKAFWTR
jgi:hypothetical protein